uniref:ABC transporter B family member 1 n=1 Tax=Rhizophora mucronata TaxID=61149 RepID=A0A2P2MI12_RHIMU
MAAITAMRGTTARVTSANCHTAVKPTTNPDTNVAT